jgi:hypothetical protein
MGCERVTDNGTGVPLVHNVVTAMEFHVFSNARRVVLNRNEPACMQCFVACVRGVGMCQSFEGEWGCIRNETFAFPVFTCENVTHAPFKVHRAVLQYRAVVRNSQTIGLHFRVFTCRQCTTILVRYLPRSFANWVLNGECRNKRVECLPVDNVPQFVFDIYRAVLRTGCSTGSAETKELSAHLSTMSHVPFNISLATDRLIPQQSSERYSSSKPAP